MTIITLLTDFGTADGYVGAMKGRILSVDPSATIVDLSHEIEPGDITAGAFALAQAASYFPDGTVHCTVVDPGVGSAREALVLTQEGRFFVGPDNGLLSLACPSPVSAVVVDVKMLQKRGLLEAPSATFHGRDLFAPLAAMLATGMEPRSLGRIPSSVERIELPVPRVVEKNLVAEVVHVDRFGNLITSIAGDLLDGIDPASARVETAGQVIDGIRRTFSDVPSNELVAYLGSAGYLEIGLRDGSAASMLEAGRGTEVLLGAVGATRPFSPGKRSH